jgi:hypothetical protein
MLPVGFKPTIAAGERPYTYALDSAATGTGISYTYWRECITEVQLNIGRVKLSFSGPYSSGEGRVEENEKIL